MATIEELLRFGKEQLEKSGNEYAKYERKVLLEEVLGCDYMHMLLNGSLQVEPEKEQRYRELIERRCSRYPLQYMLGVAHFMDYTFFVDEHVLIPRSDTEILVETADALLKERLPESGGVRVLDLCCGSGCIGISLKLYHKEIGLVLADVSEAALETAKKNLAKYDMEAEVVCGDLFKPFTGKADLIVSNPPYIETRVIDTLMPEVRDYEPVLALDGGRDGLDFYRRIVEQAPDYLEEKGWLMFEIGESQGSAVRTLMEDGGFSQIQIKKDYTGLDRVVYGHL